MLRRAGAIILFVLALLLVPPVAARQTNPISLLHSQATPDFPNQIVFSLGATSTAAAITEVQLLYGATRSDTLTVVDLDVPRDPIVKVGHTLDTQVFYFPPGTEMTYRWLIRDAAGNTLETEPLQFVYDDQRFAWSERSIGEVTVYWYEGGSTFGDTLAATVERALGDLSADLGAELSQPVRIYVYTSSADLYSALQANSEEWIGGQANPELGVILAAISPDSESEVRRIIPHEISHQVLHQVIANPYVGAPFWLDEGLAVHHQEVRDRDYDLRVADAAAQNQLIPLEALAANFPADPEQALLSYAESRDIVEYILETYGAERLQVLVAAIAAATPLDDAVQQALGRSIDDLDAEWRQTLPQPRVAAPDLSGPQVAPDERFSEAPVLPAGMQKPGPLVVTPATPFEDRPSALIGWMESLPAWATVSVAALCCVVGFVLLGVVLLAGLRMIGVDKREK